MNSKTLVWFRQDLRIKDNPALSYACDNGDIIPIYILDNVNTDKPLGGASKWWLHHTLKSLNDALDNRLQVFEGDPLQLIPELMDSYDIECAVWNRCYQPWQIKRDKQLKKKLTDSAREVKSFNGSLLWEPWDVLKKDRTPYKVYTPYYRNGCLNKPAPRHPVDRPKNINFIKAEVSNRLSIDELNLLPNIPWDSTITQQWNPGEEGAADNLQQFLSAPIKNYKEQRNIPNIKGTSRLSPYLRFGEISPHQIWYAALQASNNQINDDLNCYLSELGWREFSYYLLYHFPTLPKENFNNKFDHFNWRQDAKHVRAWELGKTGYPIIDAGMRELWQTGYMHNRVRMIVGSFLVKNLRVHWSKGEAWFWECLLDADLASNSASWQWVAGTGADAAPYFRIFNPVTQGKKFDSDGSYVRRYCPELTKLPSKYIHTPWLAPKDILEYAGVMLDKNYPIPIVDLKATRESALTAFSNLRQKKLH
jgi:deoxyribodipyrimidine photo-lyase